MGLFCNFGVIFAKIKAKLSKIDAPEAYFNDILAWKTAGSFQDRICDFARNFLQKLRQRRIFCPVGGGGAPSPFHFRTHSTSRAPRPHPQGKKSFFGIILRKKRALASLPSFAMFSYGVLLILRM